ncbi:hypothetical protein YB2330_006343 [Saitoella coloradoensis]
MSEHDAQYRKACEQCRNRKLKCTGERPICARCAKSSGTECVYLPNAPTGRPSKRARTTAEDRSPFTPVVQNAHVEQNGHGHGHGRAYGIGLEGTAGINDADLTQMLDLEFGMGDGMTSEMIRDAEGMAFVMNGMPITNFGTGFGISTSSPWDFGNYSDTIPQPQPRLQSQQQQHQFYGPGGGGYGHGQIQSPQQQQQAMYTPTMESPSMMRSYTPTMTPSFSPSLQQRQLGTPIILQPQQHMPAPVPAPLPTPTPAPAPVEVAPSPVKEQEPPKSSCCCSSKKKTTTTSTSSLPPVTLDIKPKSELALLPPPPAPVSKSRPATSIKTICVPDADGCPCGSNTTNLLISLRRIIRNAADEEAKAATPESPETHSTSTTKTEGGTGANSLSIALSIAQSATTQCSCSANCTNCASDPSLPLTSATVLGLALQVYLRAIRVLQSQSQSQKGDEGVGIEVMVGGFRVGPRNARRVALYATGLELRGLRGAMDEVIRRGDGNGNGDEEEGEGEGEGQGVVGIMVGKMRRQLGKAIETVDGMLREAEDEGV